MPIDDNIYNNIQEVISITPKNWESRENPLIDLRLVYFTQAGRRQEYVYSTREVRAIHAVLGELLKRNLINRDLFEEKVGEIRVLEQKLDSSYYFNYRS